MSITEFSFVLKYKYLLIQVERTVFQEENKTQNCKNMRAV